MTDTENMMMTNIIGNFIADNIVFGMEVRGALQKFLQTGVSDVGKLLELTYS